MSHNSEQYDTNLENFRDNTSEVERLEKYAEACDKKARTYFESMKRVSHENNLLREELEVLKGGDAYRYRAQYEKLREGLQAIIDKANRDKAKVKVIYLEDLLIGQDFVEGYNAQHK